MHCSSTLKTLWTCTLLRCGAGARPPFFFLSFPPVHSVLTFLTFEKHKIVHRGQGRSRVFHLLSHSALTKKGPQNDKTANSVRGHWRPFPFGFIVIIGGYRGVLVITLLFYYFFSRPARALHRRGSSVPGWRAALAARAVSLRRKKLMSALPEDATGGPLSTVAVRYLKKWPVKPRRSVFSWTSLFSLLPPPNSAPSLMLVLSSFWSLRFWFRF